MQIISRKAVKRSFDNIYNHDNFLLEVRSYTVPIAHYLEMVVDYWASQESELASDFCVYLQSLKYAKYLTYQVNASNVSTENIRRMSLHLKSVILDTNLWLVEEIDLSCMKLYECHIRSLVESFINWLDLN